MSNNNSLDNIKQHAERDTIINLINNTYISPPQNDVNLIQLIDSNMKILEKYENSKDVSLSHCTKIFELADQEPKVLTRCNKLLVNNIENHNVSSFYNLANKYNNVELISLSEKYILKNFMKIIQEDDFLLLSDENLEKILSSNDLNIFSESQAYESLKKWYNNENDKREHFCRLLYHIRFTNLSMQYLSETVFDELGNFNVSYKIPKKINDWYIFPDKRHTSKSVHPRRYYEETFLQISTNDNLEYEDVKEYYPKMVSTDYSWTHLRPITPDIRYSCVKILDGKLIFLGGHDVSNDVTNKNWCMDFRFNFDKYEIKPMLQARIFFEAVVYEKQLLVFGGMDNDRNEISSAEIWDSSTNVWKKIKEMNRPRLHPTAVFYKEEAYVFGGFNKNEYLKSYEVYNFEKEEWKLYESDSIKCFDYCHIKSTTLDDYIYVYECFKDSSTYEHHLKRLNPSKEEWKDLSEMPSPQECRYLISHERKIIFFGSDNNYEYNPDKDVWKEFSSQESVDNYNHIFSVPKTYLQDIKT